MIYEAMITVATFDILPTDEIFPKIFPNLKDDEPFSDKFGRIGFNTHYIIINMGTMFLIFCFNSILLLMYLPLKMLGKSFICARKLARNIESVMFFRWQIIFI